MVVPDIYILHSGEPPDEKLAGRIAGGLSGLSPKPVLMTADQLGTWHSKHGRSTLKGTVVVLLSEPMVSDSVRRSALVAAVGGTALLDFRHYFICCGTTPQEIMARVPDLAPIYESIMLRPQSDLDVVIQDVRKNFARRIPGLDALRRPLIYAFEILGAFVFHSLSRIYFLRYFIACALAVLLFLHASPVFSIPLIVLCFYTVGLGLNQIHPLDLWPWLGRRWKWPASLDFLHSSSQRKYPPFLGPLRFVGPLPFAGLVFGAAAALATRNWNSVVIPWASGLALQVVVDVVCSLRGERRFRRLRSDLPCDLPVDETSCDLDCLCSGINSCLTLRSSNVSTVLMGLLAVASVGIVGITRLNQRVTLACVAAFVLGILMPTLGAISWRTSLAQALRLSGLTTEHLRRTAPALQAVRPAMFWHVRGINPPRLASFTNHEREELLRLTVFQRFPPGQLSKWFTPRDFAFVSYAWSDEKKLQLAEILDKQLRGIGIRSFRDTRAIQDPFGVWRDQVSSALLRCTHFFLVVTPGIKTAPVARREML